jgi:hypothetical protein
MNRRQMCLSMLATVGTIPFRFPRAGPGEQSSTEPHHKIVPLPRSREELNKTMKALTEWEVVSGEPDKPGAPFVIRIYNVENQIVPPHWHPGDEHIALVKGTWNIAEGDRFNRSALREVNVGDYVFVPKEMRHFAWSKDLTIVQIHGIGPFKIILADPWTLLSDSQAMPHFKFKLNDRVRSKRGEGAVVFGTFSEKNRITEYFVEKQNGDVFAELEAELQKLE